MRIILSAGPRRSGEAWLYEVARLLLERRGDPFQAGWLPDFRRDSDHPTALLRLDETNEAWADRADVVLTCHRDLRDVAAALIAEDELFGERELMDAVDRVRAVHEFWSPRSRLDLSYEEIVGDPAAATEKVAYAIGAGVAAAEAASIAQRLDVATGLHLVRGETGRPGRWIELLSPDLAAVIEQRHGDWLRAQEYGVAELMEARRGFRADGAWRVGAGFFFVQMNAPEPVDAPASGATALQAEPDEPPSAIAALKAERKARRMSERQARFAVRQEAKAARRAARRGQTGETPT